MTHGEDIAALEATRRGDPAGLARLAELFGSDLARMAFLIVGDWHAAEDLAHDAMLAAWDAASRTTADTPVRAWLLGHHELVSRASPEPGPWAMARTHRGADGAGDRHCAV